MWGALIGLGAGLYSAYQGNKKEKKAAGYEQRSLDMADKQYNERAPLRQQGMRALGQIEAPMDMGNHMYDSGNPYAAARGRTGSVANIGNWGQNTFDLGQVQAAQGQTNERAAYDAELARVRTKLPKGKEGAKFFAKIQENNDRMGMNPNKQPDLPSGYGWDEPSPAAMPAPRTGMRRLGGGFR